MVLVGPSGCGKSTLLRMIAGLEEVTGGTIRIGERAVNNLPPSQRDIAMVFQNYALYPHKTVASNMALSLKMRGMGKADKIVVMQAGIIEQIGTPLALYDTPVNIFVDDFTGRMEVVGAPDELPPVQAEVQAAIDAAAGKSRPMVGIERFDFYERAKNAYAVIQTGERRFYGCFMFRKGGAPDEQGGRHGGRHG